MSFDLAEQGNIIETDYEKIFYNTENKTTEEISIENIKYIVTCDENSGGK